MSRAAPTSLCFRFGPSDGILSTMIRKNLSLSFCLLASLSLAVSAHGEPAAPPSGGFDNLLLSDDFEREESDDSKEEIGKNWSTNSKSRAQGKKQGA